LKIPTKWLIYFYKLGLLSLFYFAIRIVFLVYHWNEISSSPASDIGMSFLQGLRFDVAAVVFSNSLLLLWWMAPVRWQINKVARSLDLAIFCFLNIGFSMANFVDIELSSLTGQRMTLDILSLGGDWARQAQQLIRYYWVIASINLGYAIILVKTYLILQERLATRSIPAEKMWKQGLIGLAVLSVLVIGARGGIQLKPLKIVHAYIFPNNQLGLMTLNSTFTMLRSKSRNVLQRQEDFASWEGVGTALEEYRGVAQSPSPMRQRPSNVVLIILESFSMEYTGLWTRSERRFTPYLRMLARNRNYSRNFTNHYANGRRSIEALPSLLCSIPALMEEPFITSRYLGVETSCLGSVLKRQGYATAFFHGGENGTMFFDSFSAKAGFDKYFGLNEYPEKERDFDGSWGIYDEPFFEYTVEKIDQLKPPFAAVLFSLSSHQPYSVPGKYKGRFPKGTLEIHESIGYTDWSLKTFFENAQKKPWFYETLFVITADHTQKSSDENFPPPLGSYRVPLVFYWPAPYLPLMPNGRLSQHIDVMPTILDILGISSSDKPVLGESLLRRSTGVAFNRDEKGLWMVNGSHWVHLSEENQAVARKYDGARLLDQESTPTEKDVLYLKAVRQAFRNGLIENHWISSQPEEEK
jgi:phosphoglycerol transferase MdoB-like AlkP superfamily enzyme